MHAGVGDLLFWGTLAFALVVAGAVAYPVNRWLITRGKGHAVLHNSGHHPNFPTRTVGAVAATAFVFGSSVLLAEAFTSGDESMQDHGTQASQPAAEGHGGSVQEHGEQAGEDTAVPGLAVVAHGLSLQLDRAALPRGERATLSFWITDTEGSAVRDFEVEQAKRMHLIVVRRDTQGFQHLHPRMDGDGRWSTAITLPQAGSYRVFADFRRDGEKTTLGTDLTVDGPVDWQPLPAASATARTAAGYEVEASGGDARAGRESELEFTVTRDGEAVRTEPYLGAGGHLVGLREGDLGYLHTHPAEHGDGAAVPFATAFPSAGRYRLFFQFKHDGEVHTAGFTRGVAP